MLYKVSEKFYSIQGEGVWVGTPMCFLRLAQCPIGGASGLCRTWQGKEFVCDTGPMYHPKSGVVWNPYTVVSDTLHPDDIWNWVSTKKARILCITGGEPFIYDLHPIWDAMQRWKGRFRLHIETSGTQKIQDFHFDSNVWITLSPKTPTFDTSWFNVADEVKLLVDNTTTVQDIEGILPLARGTENIFLQPIEGETNVKHAIFLCLEMGLRLSCQTHKLLEVR